MEAARHSIDAYGPAEIAHSVEIVAIKYARLPVLWALIPGLLAGAFISFAALFGDLIPVTLGIIAGGPVLVALTYWSIYLRNEED